MTEDRAGTLWVGTAPRGLPADLAMAKSSTYSVREGCRGTTSGRSRRASGTDLDRDRSHQGPRVGDTRSSLAPRDSPTVPVANDLRNSSINQILETGNGRLGRRHRSASWRFCPGPQPGRYRFRTLGPAALGLAHPAMMSVAEDRHENLWVGGVTGAVKILPGGTTVFGARDGIPSAATLLAPPGRGVIGMEGGGAWRFLQFAGDTVILTELPLSNATASWGWNQMLLRDRVGDWWIGTRTGVLRFRGVAASKSSPGDTCSPIHEA